MTEHEPISFDRVAAEYDRTRWVPQSLCDSLVRKLIEETPLTFESRILEIGVGTGRLALPLSQHGCEIVGIDVSSLMLFEAKRKQREGGKLLHLLQAEASNVPIRERTMDLCLFVHVLHLLDDWKTVLKDMERILRRRVIANARLFLSWFDLPPFRLYWDSIGELKKTGAQEPEEIISYLQDSNGYRWRRFEIQNNAGKTTWKEVFGLIQRKVFSSQWGISKEQHQAAIEYVMKQSEAKPAWFNLVAHYIVDLFSVD